MWVGLSMHIIYSKNVKFVSHTIFAYVKCPTFRQPNPTSGGDFGSAEPKFGQLTCTSR